MSGITSGVGIFSGIDREKIISQLIAAASGPKTIIQKRNVELQSQSTALLDLNNQLNALKSSAQNFNSSRIFEQSAATTSDSAVATATAGAGTPAGSYSFIVDRLVSTQQTLSRGFADANVTALGATKFIFEGSEGRLDRDTQLAQLNGGNGITRGKIVITDSGGQAKTIDLTRVASVNEVVKAINDATGGRVVASVKGDKLDLVDAGGGSGTLTVADAQGSSGTAASLGLNVGASDPGDGGEILGLSINTIGRNTTLRSLNDGNGVSFNRAGGLSSPDFSITTKDGTVLQIDLGEVYENVTPTGGGTPVLTLTKSAAADIGAVLDRINTQGGGKVSAQINDSGTGLKIVDLTAGTGSTTISERSGGTTAAELGLSGSTNLGIIDGKRVIAGINSTLAANLNGGKGVSSGAFSVKGRDGTTRSFSVNTSGSVQDLLDSFAVGSGNAVTAALDANGTRIVLTDTTSGSAKFTVSGAGATALGLATDPAGVSGSTLSSSRQQHKYISAATRLDTLNAGRGVGTGTFEVTDSYGSVSRINISTDVKSVDDFVRQFNAQSSDNVKARINDGGDGILLYEVPKSGGAGVRSISVKDTSGSVAKSLNLASTAAGTGTSNTIDGTFERSVSFSAGDTLQQVADKINQAGAQVTASVISDGTGSAGARLTLTSRTSGEAGRVLVDTGGLDLGLSTISEGSNSRVFFGSSDVTKAVLLSSTTNSVSGVVSGLTIDLKSTSTNSASTGSPTPVTIAVSRDSDGIVKAVRDFVTSFNSLIARIDKYTAYDATSDKKGPLLGDSTTAQVRQALTSIAGGKAQGVGGQYQFLSQVGVSFDKDGNLTLNEDSLRTALTTNANAVRDVFAAKAQNQNTTTKQPVFAGNPNILVSVSTSGSITSQGIFELLGSGIDKYTKAVDGVITRRSKVISDQVTANTTRITALDDKLNARKDILERQFIAAEEAIGKIQGQSSVISGIKSI